MDILLDNALFEDLQRRANSRWLTDGSDNDKNNNFSM